MTPEVTDREDREPGTAQDKQSFLLRNHRNHIGFLDGIRGGLSLWVFTYHAATVVGFNTRFIPAGAIAVDIFMLLSGLLMAYTLSGGKPDQNELSGKAIGTFFIRRIFRIVPVYYLLLFVAFLFYTTLLGFASEAIAAFPPSWVSALSNDPSIRSTSVMNIIMHLTFMFGLDPHYAANMPIPDWSLTLEMQFYLVVPFLLISLRKYGLFVPIMALAIINFLASRYIGLYLSPKTFGLWPQPSFLIFKIDCFIVGVLLSLYFFDARFNRSEILCLVMVLIYFESFIFSFAAVLCFALLAAADLKSGFFAEYSSLLAKLLQAKIMKFFGDISYDLYLLHPLILLPTVHFLIKYRWYVSSPGFVRFALLLSIAAIIAIPVSYLIHKAVEEPGKRGARPICEWVLAKRANQLT